MVVSIAVGAPVRRRLLEGRGGRLQLRHEAPRACTCHTASEFGPAVKIELIRTSVGAKSVPRGSSGCGSAAAAEAAADSISLFSCCTKRAYLPPAATSSACVPCSASWAPPRRGPCTVTLHRRVRSH
jgi:hypothetical protein